MEFDSIDETLFTVIEILLYISSVFSVKAENIDEDPQKVQAEKISELLCDNPQVVLDCAFLTFYAHDRIAEFGNENKKRLKKDQKMNKSYQATLSLVESLSAFFESSLKKSELLVTFNETLKQLVVHLKSNANDFSTVLKLAQKHFTSEWQNHKWYEKETAYIELWQYKVFNMIEDFIQEQRNISRLLDQGNYEPTVFSSKSPYRYSEFDIRNDDDLDFDYEPHCWQGCKACQTDVLPYLPKKFSNFWPYDKECYYDWDKSKEFFLRCLILFDESKYQKKFEYGSMTFIFDYKYECEKNCFGQAIYTKVPWFSVDESSNKIGKLSLKNLEKYIEKLNHKILIHKHRWRHLDHLDKIKKGNYGIRILGKEMLNLTCYNDVVFCL